MANSSDDYVVHGALRPARDAILVMHLQGWIDASGAAAQAITTLMRGIDAKPVATFDADRYIDFRARRPLMELRDGVATNLSWSSIELSAGADQRGEPVFTLTGAEPDMQWNRFTQVMVDLCQQLGVTTVVSVGAYPFAAPHTRLARMSCTATSAEVANQLPYLKDSLDVPAGLTTVIEHAAHAAGMQSFGLWVQVPHYVSSMEYPAASLVLMSALRDSTGILVDTSALATASAEQRGRLDQLVSSNDDHRTMVEQLERIYDSTTGDSTIGQATLPSADELAADFERFLRDQ